MSAANRTRTRTVPVVVSVTVVPPFVALAEMRKSPAVLELKELVVEPLLAVGAAMKMILRRGWRLA